MHVKGGARTEGWRAGKAEGRGGVTDFWHAPRQYTREGSAAGPVRAYPCPPILFIFIFSSPPSKKKTTNTPQTQPGEGGGVLTGRASALPPPSSAVRCRRCPAAPGPRRRCAAAAAGLGTGGRGRGSGSGAEPSRAEALRTRFPAPAIDFLKQLQLRHFLASKHSRADTPGWRGQRAEAHQGLGFAPERCWGVRSWYRQLVSSSQHPAASSQYAPVPCSRTGVLHEQPDWDPAAAPCTQYPQPAPSGAHPVLGSCARTWCWDPSPAHLHRHPAP